MTKSIVTLSTDHRKTYVTFNLADKHGREIGANIYIREVTFSEAPDAHLYYSMEPGRYYALRTQATRNGNDYGASQPVQFFKTISEREDALTKYLKDAKKRAVKIGVK